FVAASSGRDAGTCCHGHRNRHPPPQDRWAAGTTASLSRSSGALPGRWHPGRARTQQIEEGSMSDRASDVVIIGGGPAGASAAIFTARAGLSTVVIDADKGITRRAWVENHLGFPDGIAGPELVDKG